MAQYPYFPIFVSFLLAGVVVSLFLCAARLLGPKKPSAVKGLAFECGNPPRGSAWAQFSVHFYLVAIVFLVFDVEVVFLYPWAVVFRELGLYGAASMGVFLFFFAIGLFYVWRKGVLDWK
jgi:NADH-quinone oxidoreductase subunit A